MTVERTQTSYTKVGKNAYEIGWAVTVKNGRDEARSITLRDSFPGQWAIVTADAKYTKVDSGSIEFTLNDLPPTGSTAGKVIKYVVRIEY